eukprot:326650-Rhodomonas_salina.1
MRVRGRPLGGPGRKGWKEVKVMAGIVGNQAAFTAESESFEPYCLLGNSREAQLTNYALAKSLNCDRDHWSH